MKIQRTIPGIIFLLMLGSLLFVAAMPQQDVLAQDLVRLTIINPSSQDAWLELSGPAFYNLRVLAGETKVFTPQFGAYDYILTSCSGTERGVFDLKRNRELEIETCGVRLSINNHSDRDVWLKLDGTKDYNLHVPAGQSKIYTPFADVYDYTLHHCGTFVKGELDLTNQEVIEVPDCGSVSHYGPQEPSYIDEGRMLNLVRVTFENETGHAIMIIIEGPTVHVFSFNADQDKEYTIPHGYYDYTLYACGTISTGFLLARAHIVHDLECP
jgi:hypothetical protein